MASRGRRPLKPRAGFGRNEEVKEGVHDSILKQARKSGQLNLSGRSLASSNSSTVSQELVCSFIIPLRGSI